MSGDSSAEGQPGGVGADTSAEAESPPADEPQEAASDAGSPEPGPDPQDGRVGEAPGPSRRRLALVAALGALSAFLGGLAVTILEPGSIPVAVVLVLVVGGLVTAAVLRVRG